MTWSNNSPRRQKRMQWKLVMVLLAVLVLVCVGAWLAVSARQTTVDTTQIKSDDSGIKNPSADDSEQQPASFDSVALQSLVDSWAEQQSGTSSVVLASSDGEIIASYNPDEVYFAASLYKLYVAYEGYRQVDAGEVNPEEQYSNGNTRAECLDKMIRDSDSPCGEKLWVEIGKAELTEILSDYGFEATSMSAITTTADDAAQILVRIATGEGLSEASRAALLDSMKTQDALYRRGLPSGFSDSVTVYNKVGWNELVEWHDTAIVEFADGRQIIVTVLTKNVGRSNVASLGTLIEETVGR